MIIGARLPVLVPPRTDKAAAQLLSVPPGIIMTEHEAVYRDAWKQQCLPEEAL